MFYLFLFLLALFLVLPAICCLFAGGIIAAIGGIALFCWLGLFYLALAEWRHYRRTAAEQWDETP